ncbi:hypothetical protein K2173_008600 [Erythroxylum novogranatense]|uniref:Two-component response regulator n=1 Tax=Erythroxylum novogranatense TaxID=1862640 RepID=A0AAV8SLT4_9ROSI|nr:hypothetical protein K2173_008600 [Erythroxylum novogranatense]
MGRERFVPASSSKTTSSLLKIQILVVDDDATSLAVVASMLRTCGPQVIDPKLELSVVTVKSPLDALLQLRLKQGVFDLVVTDLYMPVMNGIELQQHVNEEFNLPVVIMSSDDKESVIMESLKSGAAFYMVKPINQNDLKNVWQYAVTSKKNSNEDINSSSVTEERQDGKGCRKKKKTKRKIEEEHEEEKEEEETTTVRAVKKTKVVWTNSLHNRFLHAISHLGLEKAVPKKILEFMSVPGLTRENVASHLQKYRIFLKKVADRGNSLAANNLSETERASRSTFASSYASVMLKSVQQRYPQFSCQQKLGVPVQLGLGGHISSALGSSSVSSLTFPNHQQASSARNYTHHLPHGTSNLIGNRILARQPCFGNPANPLLHEGNRTGTTGSNPNRCPLLKYQQQFQSQPNLDQNCNNPSGCKPASGIGNNIACVSNSRSYVNNISTDNPGMQMVGGGGRVEMRQNSFHGGNGFMNWNIKDHTNVTSIGDGSFNYLVQSGKAIAGQFPASITGTNQDNRPVVPPTTQQQNGLRTGAEEIDLFNIINDGSALDDILNQQHMNGDFGEILSQPAIYLTHNQQQVGDGFNFPSNKSSQPEINFSRSNSYKAEVNSPGNGPQQNREPIMDAEYNTTRGIQNWSEEFLNSWFDDAIF